jgi:hypothetical protein
MGGQTRLEPNKRSTMLLVAGRICFIAIICFGVFAAGCSKSEQDDGKFNTSKLPRVTGAKEIFASPATTNFTSPDSVAQTADTVEKALAGLGWQKYIAPNTAYANDPSMRIMSLKKGHDALSVYISVAPAQNNATSVQYSGIPLKTDLPFTKDATNIEYSPERVLLTLTTAEPLDKTLDFYRKELGAVGWSMWSEKTNGKQPADAPSGVVHDKGAYAHYVTDKDSSVALVLTLQKADDGKTKVELKQWPVGILEPLYQANINSDNRDAPRADVTRVVRLDGAVEQTDRSAADRMVYSVPGSVANTTEATAKLLAADGWQRYVAPLDEKSSLMTVKKGRQAMTVSFSQTSGQPGHSSVYYSPTWLNFAVPFPDNATDIVFDENRPYLSATTAASIEATRDFYNKQLTAAGWLPLSAADAAVKWPNAKIDGALAYYIRGPQRVISVSLKPDSGKTSVEIRVPAFARPQNIEFDKETFGLPQPKLIKTAGGTGGNTTREAHAHVPAEMDVVLAFYRRELAARNWKEGAQGAVVTPDQVVLNFSSDQGTLALKLGHKYDLTISNLLQQVAKPVASAQPPAQAGSVDDMMKQVDRMVRDATNDAMRMTPPPAPPQASSDTGQALGPLAGNTAPVPVPETAEDVDFADGKLEFSSPSSVKAVADFYRATMKQQGWQSQSSVINNANMVVLNFSKPRNAVSFTIMKMGNKTNVSADGSGLKVAAVPGAAPPAKESAADTPSPAATEDDLVVEESGGLPVPKRHTMTQGEKTPFRRELTASVPLDLATVLAFYRRELGKLNWKEDAGAVVAQDRATVTFVVPDGPGTLKLGRKDGETSVSLATRDKAAATKAGILPQPGQVKALFGNILDSEATITINKRAIKVGAGVGVKNPDGPTLDLPPGKHKFSLQMRGKPATTEEVEVGPDETWGLMIGPGGLLPMHVY